MPVDSASVSRSTGSGAKAAVANHVSIDGVTLNLDEIVDQSYFTEQRVNSLREAFLAADPVPHIVIDGLFSPGLLERVYADFDRLNWNDWRRWDDSHQFKRASAPKTWLGDASQLYFSTISSGRFVDFLEQITGIRGLITDPHFYRGGLHNIPTGGRFATHIDFNKHDVTRLDNRLVFITYLNKDWQSAFGGSLELWEPDEHKCVKEIVPEFGRSILYYQSPKSLHGHPKPVIEPNGRPRRSVAAYFYTNGRPDTDNSVYHTTQFAKSGEPLANERLSNALKYLLPPVFVDAVRKAKQLIRRQVRKGPL